MNNQGTREKLGAGETAVTTQTRRHKESFTGIGEVTVQTFRMVDGVKVYNEDEVRYNLIVKDGRKTLIDLMLGLTNKRLKYVRWGSGGAPRYPDGDPLNNYDVQDTDLDVATALIEKPLNAPTRVTPTEALFTETIISDEVDSDVNEAALFFEELNTANKSIFARITFPTIRLTAEQGTGIELRWAIRFNKVEESNF